MPQAQAPRDHIIGTVTNLTGPIILPEDREKYLEFALCSTAEDSDGMLHNGVFYIRLSDDVRSEMVATVARALVTRNKLLVHWTSSKPWAPGTDPSYVIDRVAVAQSETKQR